MDEHPGDVRFPRYRGHRFISTRKFDFAIADLKRAAEIAPVSFDVSYHLGLAYYLRGDYNHAAREYQRCLTMAAQPKPQFMRGMPADWRPCQGLDDNARVAITEWAWRANRRAGKPDEAEKLLATITDAMKVTDNQSYYRTLLLYKGLRTEVDIPSDANAVATASYGLGLWHWLQAARIRPAPRGSAPSAAKTGRPSASSPPKPTSAAASANPPKSVNPRTPSASSPT
jgi:tetratricopeptide (TPR) repeat protein